MYSLRFHCQVWKLLCAIIFAGFLLSANAQMPLTNILAITAGGNHTCALTIIGGVKCWGVGSGYLRIDVPGLANGVTAISTGGDHTCALTAQGGVKCWGNNQSGELGDGTKTQRETPIDVVGLTSGVSSVVAGVSGTCAVLSGSIKCWGSRGVFLGQSFGLTPENIIGFTSDIQDVAMGNGHICALTYGGIVKCMGRNSEGQLGDNTYKDSFAPVTVLGLDAPIIQIAAVDYYTCALTSFGSVKCWGGHPSSISYQLQPFVTNVVGLTTNVISISVGSGSMCALMLGGGVKCLGANYYGQLGDISLVKSDIPVNVVGLNDSASAIAVGGSHACILTNTRGVKCWGYGEFGQLGSPTSSYRVSPVAVIGMSSVVDSITAGYSHACATIITGGVKCWGNNSKGQLGDNTIITRVLPTNVLGLDQSVLSISAGGSHTCAILSGGKLQCWGRNSEGQLGDNAFIDRSFPANVNGLESGVVSVATGEFHTCALTNVGGVKCWGSPQSGILGNGTLILRSIPTDVIGLTSGVSKIAVSVSHSCALTNSGGVKCWGGNNSGQLGDNTLQNKLIPVDVVGLTNGIVAIAVGGNHTCALNNGGRVTCWGENSYGQLGNGSTIASRVPVELVELNGAVSIAAGNNHTCALTNLGGVKCWGINNRGQLGISTNLNQVRPVDVSGLTSGVIAVSTNGTCAYTKTGEVYCWGDNTSGQIGDGTIGNYRTIPTDIPDTPGLGNYTDLWWGGSSEDGWGMTVSQHNYTQVNILFIYDAAGKPQWVSMPGGSWNSTFTTYTGDLYIPVGSPFSSYNSALHSVGAKVGTLAVTYTSAITAQLQYTINGISGTKSLQRYQFGAIDNTPGLQVGDLWWGGIIENGWGVNITQQYRSLFAVWYTYDANGKTVWYSMSGGSWNGNFYTGLLYYSTSSPWIGAQYNSSLFKLTQVGSVQFIFNNENFTTMTYNVNGIMQTKSLTRLPY